jgi:hypothetical protein
VICRLRIGFADAGKPNVVLFTAVFQAVKAAWFKVFVESTRRSRLNRFRRRNVRASAESSVN